MESLFNFLPFQKIITSGSWKFLRKKCVFLTFNNSKPKMKYEKSFLNLVKQTIPVRLIWVSTLLVQPFSRWSIYRRPRFSRFLWITRFLWKKRERVHGSYLTFFLFLYVSTNFYYDWTKNKEKNWEYGVSMDIA